MTEEVAYLQISSVNPARCSLKIDSIQPYMRKVKDWVQVRIKWLSGVSGFISDISPPYRV